MKKPAPLLLRVFGVVGVILFALAGFWIGSTTKPGLQPTPEGPSTSADPIPLAESMPAVESRPLAEPQPLARQTPMDGNEPTLDLGDNLTMKFVRIAPGKFTMGSPGTEPQRGENELQHEVTISKPFFMAATHVTVDQFATFATQSAYTTDAERAGQSVAFQPESGAGAFENHPGLSWRHPGFEQTGNHPVVHVSWNDTQAFCQWLSQKTGRTVRLPTEAQWEFACRAGTTTAFPWGDSPDDGKGWANLADPTLHAKFPPNHGLNWTFVSWDDGYVFTSPVASFKPNAFGLYDMLGNAAQLCQEARGPYGPDPVTDPEGPANGTFVTRGGSWATTTGPNGGARSASRGQAYRATWSMSAIGFRVVMTAN